MAWQVEIVIRDEQGKEQMRVTGDAMRPQQFKTPYDEPKTDGTYSLFAITYQPTVQLKPISRRA